MRADEFTGDDGIVFLEPRSAASKSNGYLSSTFGRATASIRSPLPGRSTWRPRPRSELDLRQTTFLGSTAIALFVDTQKRLTAERERLRIRSPHKFPRRVLKIAGLEGWIES
jgi:hypothetical protein